MEPASSWMLLKFICAPGNIVFMGFLTCSLAGNKAMEHMFFSPLSLKYCFDSKVDLELEGSSIIRNERSSRRGAVVNKSD